MPVLSIFCRFASWVTGGSSVLVSVSLSAVSSRTCVGLGGCRILKYASRFRLSPRLWSAVRRVVVRKRVILGCDVTLCLCRLAPGASSVLVRFFRGPRCHCLVIASQCLVACLSSRMCPCCCLSLSFVFGVFVSSLAVAGPARVQERSARKHQRYANAVEAAGDSFVAPAFNPPSCP